MATIQLKYYQYKNITAHIMERKMSFARMLSS